MRRAVSEAFTIVEVILVLAISSIILAAAIAMYSGQGGKTQFSQSMRDLESKIQSYAIQVNNGTGFDLQNNACVSNVATGHRPQLIQGTSSNLGTNEDCILLGRLVQANLNDDTLYIYTVIGNAKNATDGTDATSVDQANPEPSIDGGGSYKLYDTYKLASGTVYSSKIDSDPDTYSLVGLYTTLNSGSNVNSVRGLAYPTPNVIAHISPDLQVCVENSRCPAGAPASKDFMLWKLCIKSDSSDQYGLLKVNNSSSGVTTDVTIGSTAC